MAKRKKPEDPSLFDAIEPDDRRAGGARLGDPHVAARERRRRRHRRQRLTARGRPVALLELRAVGHHGSGAARRPRRAQAGAAPHPLHDVGAEPDRRHQAPEVREGRRRRHGQLPSARRHGAVRNAGANGAVVFAALSAGRRLRQLRIARRRQRRRDALHRVPAGPDQRRNAVGDRSVRRCRSARTTTAPRPSRWCFRRAFPTCS